MGHGRSGIQVWPPVLTRPPGRPRVIRFRGSAMGRTIKRRKCGRCGQPGHIARKCSLGVRLGFGHDDAFDEAAATAEVEKAAKSAAAAVSARYVCL